MAEAALALLILYLLLAFAVRVAVALRTTGSTGISRARSMPAVEALGGGLFLAAIALGAVTPPLVMAGVLEPIDGLDRTGLHVAGFVLAGIGIAGTFAAQMAMGSSWRIGVDPSETTDLVTDGVFSVARNPIYTFMIVAWVGLAMLVPTWVSLASIAVAVIAFEIQVRLVEEPHMIRTHGETYLAWARRVGRFVPGSGRL
jgi:protein-S-isoprenylcysteine O-methyltransferase Ste14